MVIVVDTLADVDLSRHEFPEKESMGVVTKDTLDQFGGLR
jgi:hypothetical protein